MTRARIGIVAAVNNDDILERNLKQSSLIKNEQHPLLEIRDAKSAGDAYNQGLTHFNDTDLIIFAHQDAYLPQTWYEHLMTALAYLEEHDKKWAVLGVFGKDHHGNAMGKLWDQGLHTELDHAVATPTVTQSLDEVVIILNPKVGLRFDQDLPSFHLFGADIVTQATSANHLSYVINAPIVHNSQRIQSLGGSYAIAYRYLQQKWRTRLPINAVCSKITRWGIEYQRIRFGLAYRRVLGVLPKRSSGSLHFITLTSSD